VGTYNVVEGAKIYIAIGELVIEQEAFIRHHLQKAEQRCVAGTVFADEKVTIRKWNARVLESTNLSTYRTCCPNLSTWPLLLLASRLTLSSGSGSGSRFDLPQYFFSKIEERH